jgi:hypothetical protein
MIVRDNDPRNASTSVSLKSASFLLRAAASFASAAASPRRGRDRGLRVLHVLLFDQGGGEFGLLLLERKRRSCPRAMLARLAHPHQGLVEILQLPVGLADAAVVIEIDSVHFATRAQRLLEQPLRHGIAGDDLRRLLQRHGLGFSSRSLPR